MGTINKIKQLQKLPAVILLLFVFVYAPVFVKAQFVQIRLDIPATMGVDGIGPIELFKKQNPETGSENNRGMLTFSVFAPENIQPLVTIYTTDRAGISDIKWCWKNNGDTTIPDENSFVRLPASFPLSNSGRLIENIRGRPDILNSKLFVQVYIPENTSETGFNNNVEIQIEYN